MAHGGGCLSSLERRWSFPRSALTESPYFCAVEFFKKYETWHWQRIQRHILYWLLWSAFLVIINTLIGNTLKSLDDHVRIGQWIAFEATVLPIKIGAAYTIAYWVMPRYLYTKKYGYFVAYSVVVLLFFAVILYLVYAHFVHPIILHDSQAYTIEQFVYKGVQLIYITAMVICIKFFQNYLHEQERNQSLVQQKVEAELKYLRNQVQPHFLFNTLNNIYGLVLSKDQRAGEAIVTLSNLLSFMLYEGDTKRIPLAKELEMLDHYVELELLRYQRRLQFQFDKGTMPVHYSIAPLLLLPFVENAFKHGPAKEEGMSFITIKMDVQEQVLSFFIENSYSSVDQENEHIQSGIGLGNIKKRLELIYPDRHSLQITKGETFRVYLSIELEKA
ncbi:MAG: histidine kinase [Bacteroidota bacterium]